MAETYRFTGRDAENYERLLGPILFEPSAVEFVARLRGLPAPRAVLETSAGSGRLTRHLRAALPESARLVATDLNEDMLRLAEATLRDPRIEYRTADAAALPFDEASFDRVVNQYGLMFVPDLQRAFDEAHRVLEPGGRFAFATWDRTDSMPLFELIIDRTIAPRVPAGSAARVYQPFSLHDPDRLAGHCRAAGFTGVRVERIGFGGMAGSPAAVVAGLFTHHPLGALLREQAPDAVDAVAAELEARIAAQFGSDPARFELRALFGLGEKQAAR